MTGDVMYVSRNSLDMRGLMCFSWESIPVGQLVIYQDPIQRRHISNPSKLQLKSEEEMKNDAQPDAIYHRS
jgi:hypothetical protein